MFVHSYPNGRNLSRTAPQTAAISAYGISRTNEISLGRCLWRAPAKYRAFDAGLDFANHESGQKRLEKSNRSRINNSPAVYACGIAK